MENQTNNEKETQKNIALSFLRELVALAPDEVKSSPEIGLGPKTLTIEQLVGEIEDGTEEGDWMVEAIIGLINEFQLDKKFRGCF
jgi:hypothetical protein